MTDLIRKRTTVDEDAKRLDDAARDAWSEYVSGRQWSLWMRLSWASPVSEHLATMHLEKWELRVVTRIRGAAVRAGIHSDTERRHAHALVFIPRGSAPPNPPPCPWLPAIALAWHQQFWPHGLIWLERYSPKKSERPDGKHGAALYLAKDPGAVIPIGQAPLRRHAR
jgi:hypothetical protein